MASPATTMKDLLNSLCDKSRTAITAATYFTGIKIVKRGVLPPRTQYPVLTFLPRSETIVQYRAGGRYVVDRLCEAHIYVRDLRSNKQGIDSVQQYLDDIQQLFRANTTLTDSGGAATTTNVEFQSFDFGVSEIEGGYIQHGVVPMIWRSHEDLPTRILTSTITDNPDTGDIYTAIYNQLYGKRAGTLAAVGTFTKGEFGPKQRATRPFLIVSADNALHSQGIYAGADSINGEYAVTVLSQVLGGSNNEMDDHLDIVEPIKDALQEIPHWGGKCLNSAITGIDYSTWAGNNLLHYQTTVRLSTIGKDNN